MRIQFALLLACHRRQIDPSKATCLSVILPLACNLDPRAIMSFTSGVSLYENDVMALGMRLACFAACLPMSSLRLDRSWGRMCYDASYPRSSIPNTQ